jgi:hypothetical protein
MILGLLGAVTVVTSCSSRCPCTVAPGQDTLSRTTIVRQARSDAYAVVLGNVARIDTLAWDTLFLANSRRPIVEPRLVRYRFESVTSWKGPRDDQIDVFVHRPYTSCGRSLELHQEYLLFAYPSQSAGRQGIVIDACSRIELKAQAESTVNILGRPRHRPRNRPSGRSA